MLHELVVNCRKTEFDVYIGRPSVWGNKFLIGPDGTREEVIEKYELWLLSNEYLMSRLPELKGKVLGCFCRPRRCHGDVLARLANQ